MPCRYERSELRPWTYHCLFGLLSVSGLRLGEARNLELQDVDLKAAVLTIRGAKFGKSRLVPLHASTCKVLADYIARRNRHWAARPVSSYLFVSNWGNRLDGADIHRTFYALSRQIGLHGVADSHGPRLHDSGADARGDAPARAPLGGSAMTTPTSFAPLLKRFFTQRLMQQRQASPHTISSYRDTFRQFLKFVQPDFDNCYRHDRYLSRRINALGVLAKTPMYA